MSVAPPAKPHPLCPDCGETDPTKFGRNKNSASGLHYYCRACCAARTRRYAAANPEKVRESRRRTTAKRGAKYKAYMARYRETHREQLRASQKAWIARNRERHLEWQRNYQMVKYARRKSDPEAQLIRREEIAERDGWRCHLCGGRVTRQNWSLDHLIPQAVGGKHRKENVALAHALCNTRRHVNCAPAQLRLIG